MKGAAHQKSEKESMRPSIIEGWNFEREEYEKAHEEDKLVKLVTELSNVCNLSCEGCFTKKVDGSWTERGKRRLENEQDYNALLALIDEADLLGVKTIDIVGAGEPTLDPTFENFVDYALGKGKYVVVFTHGASPKIGKYAERWKNSRVTFFIKLWSMNPELQNGYVGGSVKGYTERRNETLEKLIALGYNAGRDVEIDGIPYRTTRIGADILVMKSNYDEIPDLFRFCRRNNIMPEIKTYIPEGPTRFEDDITRRIYSPEQLKHLRKEEVSPAEFMELRRELERIDNEEFGIQKINVIYPQGCKCTQSVASLYVTIEGDIRSCVGSHISYGIYTPNRGILKKVLEERKEKERVGFGCVPRLDDARLRGIELSPEMRRIYGDGMR